MIGRGIGPMRMVQKGERAKNQWGTMMRIWRYLRRQRWALVVTMSMVMISTLLNLLGPYLMGVAIDHYIIPHDLAGLGHIGVLMLLCYAIASLLTWAQSWVMASASQE